MLDRSLMISLCCAVCRQRALTITFKASEFYFLIFGYNCYSQIALLAAPCRKFPLCTEPLKYHDSTLLLPSYLTFKYGQGVMVVTMAYTNTGLTMELNNVFDGIMRVLYEVRIRSRYMVSPKYQHWGAWSLFYGEYQIHLKPSQCTVLVNGENYNFLW